MKSQLLPFLAFFLLVSIFACQQNIVDPDDDDVTESGCTIRPDETFTGPTVTEWIDTLNSFYSCYRENYSIRWPGPGNYLSVPYDSFFCATQNAFGVRFYLGIHVCTDGNSPSGKDSIPFLFYKPLDADCNEIGNINYGLNINISGLGTHCKNYGTECSNDNCPDYGHWCLSNDNAQNVTSRYRNTFGVSLTNEVSDICMGSLTMPLAYQVDLADFLSFFPKSSTSGKNINIYFGAQPDPDIAGLFHLKIIFDDDEDFSDAEEYVDFAAPCPKNCGKINTLLMQD